MKNGDDQNVGKEFEINIRLATHNDINNIIKIVDNVLVNNVKKPDDSGFLIFKPEHAEYFFRLENNKFKFIAEVDNTIVGFIVAFTSEEILMNLKNGYLEYENELLKYCREKSEKYLWLDQLAVFPCEYRRARLGTSLTKRVLDEAFIQGYKSVFGSISLCPDFNIPSLQFISKFNMKIIHSIDIENRKWGIFHGKYI